MARQSPESHLSKLECKSQLATSGEERWSDGLFHQRINFSVVSACHSNEVVPKSDEVSQKRKALESVFSSSFFSIRKTDISETVCTSSSANAAVSQLFRCCLSAQLASHPSLPSLRAKALCSFLVATVSCLSLQCSSFVLRSVHALPCHRQCPPRFENGLDHNAKDRLLCQTNMGPRRCVYPILEPKRCAVRETTRTRVGPGGTTGGTRWDPDPGSDARDRIHVARTQCSAQCHIL